MTLPAVLAECFLLRKTIFSNTSTNNPFFFAQSADLHSVALIVNSLIAESPIFLSTAGDLHSSEFDIVSNEYTLPIPKSIYGTHKLLLENYTKLLHSQYDFTSIVLRTTNVYGGKIDSKRVNGLIDKLICNNGEIVMTSNIKTTVNFIHISDLINLILKSLDVSLKGFNLFLVGSEKSISIQDLIEKISTYISTNIVFKNENSNPSYINIDTSKVQKYFNWKCNYSIDSGIIKQVQSLNSL